MKTANEAWQQAQEYAGFACENLTLTNWRRENELDGSIDALTIHFLFPNVSDADRASLFALNQSARALTLGLNTHPRARAHEELVRDSEQRHVQMMNEVESRILPRLTPLQQEIFRDHIGKVHFTNRKH